MSKFFILFFSGCFKKFVILVPIVQSAPYLVPTIPGGVITSVNPRGAAAARPRQVSFLLFFSTFFEIMIFFLSF